MKIISWNTNGLRGTIKQGYFDPLFSEYKPDVVCLQETKCEPGQLPDEIRIYKDYSSYFAYSKTIKGYSGVAIYSKLVPEKVEYGFGIKKFDDEGRTLVMYFKNFVLINCYFPNGGLDLKRLDFKLEFYDAFLKFINKLRKSGYNIIFTGDLNVAHAEIDLARPKENVDRTGFLPIERAWLDKVVKDNWVDVFRNLYPNKKDIYTYWDQKTRARDRNIGWRIDYFISDKSLVKKIQKFETLSEYYGSDHCPIMIEIK